MNAPVQIGRYQVLRRLGGGGMGTVFLGRDPELDRLVALKLLKDDLSDNPELRERFAREARSAARLRHPNIVTIFDIGEHEGRAFIAMEHVPGEALADTIRRGAPMPLTRKLALVEMLCAGLQHAHRAGVVHRDVKPANLMVDADGVLKIVDFGIARVADSSMTRDGTLVGSINYMSPEQIGGKPVDHRSDIFAVGAVFYELLTCRLAFPGGLSDGVFARICQDPPVPLTTLCPGIDEEIVAVVDRALQKDAAARYQDLSAMARDVSGVRGRLGPDAPSDSTIAAMTSAATMPPGATPAPQVTPAFIGSRTPSGRPVATPASADRSTDAQRLLRLRQEQVDQHLEAARREVERGAYSTAIEHAERAASIDPNERRAITLIEFARAQLDARRDSANTQSGQASVVVARTGDTAAGSRAEDPQQRQRIADIRADAAQMAFDRREFAKAQTLIEQAAAFDPSSTTIAGLKQQIQAAANAAREAEQRRQELDREVAAARASLEHGDLAGARPHVDRARALAAGDERVHALALRLERATIQADRAPAQVVVGGAASASSSEQPRSRLPLFDRRCDRARRRRGPRDLSPMRRPRN